MRLGLRGMNAHRPHQPNAKIKTLFLTPSLSNGGAERFVSSLVCNLDRNRFSPHVCLLRGETSYPVPSDVKVTVLNKSSPWHIPRTISRLAKLLDTEKPDVAVGTITFTDCLLAAATLFSRHRPPIIARFGNEPSREYSRTFQVFLKPLIRRLLSRSRAFVANSASLARSVEEYFAFDTVETLYNPLNTDHLTRLARSSHPIPETECSEPTLVAVGRLEQQKRFDVLLDAFSRVRTQIPCRLLILGEGQERQQLEHQISRLDLQNDVTLLGFCDNPFPYILGADLFVLTSDHEGMPNALVEAQALGIPAVATDCPSGPDEIITDGLTGVLTPVNDASAIASAIGNLLENDQIRTTMGRAAAVRTAEQFGITQTVPAWEQLLSRLV